MDGRFMTGGVEQRAPSNAPPTEAPDAVEVEATCPPICVAVLASAEAPSTSPGAARIGELDAMGAGATTVAGRLFVTCFFGSGLGMANLSRLRVVMGGDDECLSSFRV
jgi:hypothetical protein